MHARAEHGCRRQPAAAVDAAIAGRLRQPCYSRDARGSSRGAARRERGSFRAQPRAARVHDGARTDRHPAVAWSNCWASDRIPQMGIHLHIIPPGVLCHPAIRAPSVELPAIARLERAAASSRRDRRRRLAWPCGKCAERGRYAIGWTTGAACAWERMWLWASHSLAHATCDAATRHAAAATAAAAAAATT